MYKHGQPEMNQEVVVDRPEDHSNLHSLFPVQPDSPPGRAGWGPNPDILGVSGSADSGLYGSSK
jgi:hypothetical protein